MPLYKPGPGSPTAGKRIDGCAWSLPRPGTTFKTWSYPTSSPTPWFNRINANAIALGKLYDSLTTEQQAPWNALAVNRPDLCHCIGAPMRLITEQITTAQEVIEYTGPGGDVEGQVYDLTNPFNLAQVLCAWTAIPPDLPNDLARVECEEGAQVFGYLRLLNQQGNVIAKLFHWNASDTPGGGASELTNLARQILTPADILPGVTDSVVRQIQAVVEGESLSQPPQSITVRFTLPETIELSRVQ